MSDLIRGNQFLRSGQLEEAIAAYEKAIACNPRFHWPYCKLGEALEQLGSWEEAANSYQKAIEFNSNFTCPHYKMGTTLVKNGKIDKGINFLQEALKQNPNNYIFYQKLGEALAKKGQWKEVIENYEKAIKIKPNLSLPNELLEWYFAVQNGIDFLSMKGEGKHSPYTLLCLVHTQQLQKSNLISDITAIHIKRRRRFGNSIRQLSNAYYIANALGIQKIYLPNFWYIKKGKSYTFDGIQIINTSFPDFVLEKIVLQGDFWHLGIFKNLVSYPPNFYLNIQKITDIVNFKNMFSGGFTEKDLVIHIRSGDIFQKQKPHVNYGQPPLSFYKKIIEIHKWHSISLVFENKSNPVIEPLINFAKSNCSQVEEISGNLRSDIEYLLKAKTLVVGRGTFATGIAVLSKNLKTVYSFEDKFNLGENTRIDCIKIVDQQGFYKSNILNGNWKNTKWQRKLMLEYPQDALEFEKL